MFGFFKHHKLSDQILVDVGNYLQARPGEREVFRDAAALSLGITMRMISRWPQNREPLYLVLQDIRHRLHPDGMRLLSQQFSNSAGKAKSSRRKSLMYGYGVMAYWLITAAQQGEHQTSELAEDLERYEEFFSQIFVDHTHLLCDDSLNQLHEKFYIKRPGDTNVREDLKKRADKLRV